MIQMEFCAPFAQPPVVAVAVSDGASNRLMRIRLPMLAIRFLQPWTLAADEYFRYWRAAGLSEKQTSFKFSASYDAASVRRLLSEGLKLAVLDNVDPIASNSVAAGFLALKSGAAPPSDASGFCLLRLEVNLNAPNGTAARLTVRSKSMVVADGLVKVLAATWANTAAPFPS